QADRYATAWIELQQRACEAESSVMQACLGRRLKQFSATTALWVEADVGIVERAVGMSLALPAVADCLDPERAAEVGADDGGDATSVRSLDEAAAAFGAGRFEEAQAQVDAGLSEVEAGDATWFELQTLAGRVALARGDGELASAAFERVLAAADGTSARPAVADASIGLVEAQGMVGSDFEADLALARAAEIAVGSAGNPPLARAALEAATARVLIRAGKFDEGLARVERAREVLEGLGERARTELGDVLHVTAALLYEKGRVDEATSFAERAVDVRTEVLGEAHPDVAASMAIVGTLRLAKGDAAGARAVFDDVLQRQRASIGSEHPNYGRALLALGSAQKVLGELEPARATFAEAVTVLEATLEASDPRIMAARLNLAFVEHDLGNLEAAGAAYAATLPLQRAALGERHPMVAITLANYGRLQLEVGGLDEARTLLEEALSIRSEVLGPTHERTLLAMVALAEVEIAANELDAAAARSTPALAQFEATLGAEHPRVAEALIVQGKVALRRGDAAEATASFERATSIRAKNDPDPLALNAARVLWAQALDAAGDTAQARITAATVDVEQLGGSELRGWCDSDCAARVVSLRGGAEDPAASAP
ncbi:MAG: tetratricopeptide repeat protein, partial [Myxococcota bacterium]